MFEVAIISWATFGWESSQGQKPCQRNGVVLQHAPTHDARVPLLFQDQAHRRELLRTKEGYDLDDGLNQARPFVFPK